MRYGGDISLKRFIFVYETALLYYFFKLIRTLPKPALVFFWGKILFGADGPDI
jgi:hypothetical protein